MELILAELKQIRLENRDTREQLEMIRMENKATSSKLEQISELIGHERVKRKELESNMKSALERVDKDVWENNRRLEKMDQLLRKSNLIFRGLQEEDEAVEDISVKIINIIEQYYKFTPRDVIKAYRLGRKGSRPRPVFVEFDGAREPAKILAGRIALKSTEIYVDEDCTQEARQRKFQLLNEAKKCREAGKKAFVRNEKLIVDAEVFVWNSSLQEVEFSHNLKPKNEMRNEKIKRKAQRQNGGGCSTDVIRGVESRKAIVSSLSSSFLVWNVAGIYNKQPEFWKFIYENDFIVLLETWTEQKDFLRLKGSLNSEFDWFFVPASRVHKKGRAMGGQLVGVRSCAEMKVVNTLQWEKGLILDLKIGLFSCLVVTIYNSVGIKEVRDLLSPIILDAEIKDKSFYLVGDFNARIGDHTIDLGTHSVIRQSEDLTLNPEGEQLIDWCYDHQLDIANGVVVGDELGKITFVGMRGHSVVDYILTNDLDSITRMFVDERVDSDHLPIVFNLFVELNRQTGKQAQSRGKWIWNSKLAANFTAKIDNWVEEFQGNPQVGLTLSSGPRRRLLGWINEMWRQQVWLPQWRVGIICPIFKAGNASLPSNYRGITLLNGIYKVITAMMAKRISSWLEENHKIKESQAGFRRGYSTRDHLFTLNSLIENRFRKKGKLYVLFLDFKVAFDSIDRTKLFEKIWKIGIRGHMFSMIKKIYEET
uniref:Reverse transcriptase domain-containing protein n=1 Tax=Strigamia maritima TaxID=126957 RepID=T1IVY6_STRMM